MTLALAFVSAEELLPLDADAYTMELTSEVVNPDVKFPHSKIPMSAYQSMKKSQVFTLQFADDQKVATIQPMGLGGRLDSGTISNRVYKLGFIYGAGQRLTIERTEQGLVSTFTQHGSGRAVLWSKRGFIKPLVPAAEDGKQVKAETVTFSQFVEALDKTFTCEYRNGTPFEGSLARPAASDYMILSTFKAGVELPQTSYFRDRETKVWKLFMKNGVPVN